MAHRLFDELHDLERYDHFKVMLFAINLYSFLVVNSGYGDDVFALRRATWELHRDNLHERPEDIATCIRILTRMCPGILPYLTRGDRDRLSDAMVLADPPAREKGNGVSRDRPRETQQHPRRVRGWLPRRDIEVRSTKGESMKLFWSIVHNLIAHPLLITRARWADRFHDWTADRM